MTKLNITPFTIEQALAFNDQDLINGFIVGDNNYGLRQVRSFSLEDIELLRSKTTKNIYVAVNKILHNHEFETLKPYLIRLEKIKVDGIIISDIGILQFCKKNNINLNFIYNTETTITNKSFATLANNVGIQMLEVAKEITLKEITEIANQNSAKISINIHGHIYMYQSIRKMIDNYETVIGNKLPEKDYYLYDEERQLYYPLIQNEQGTHVLASTDLCMISKLDKLKTSNVDFYKIDGFAYKPNDYVKIVNLYIKALNLEPDEYEESKQDLEKAAQAIDSTKKYGTGFYFKKTIY